MDSDRSAYRPSQKRLSATRLGRSKVARLTSNGCAGGRSKLNSGAGPSPSSQVSLLPPPRCIETTMLLSDAEMRLSPPGITR
jgi:hypothetical protein